MQETDLYPPVKAFLEAQGYEVKGEIQDCDVVAIRGDELPVIVELKMSFSLALVLQGVARQGISDDVYLAVPKLGSGRKRRQSILGLCRRLGLGLMLVRSAPNSFVDVLLDPGVYAPKQRTARKGRLLREFQHRVGDPSMGGGNKRPVMTAYRQDALRCAMLLRRDGPTKAAEVAKTTHVLKAASILQRDVYGWFERVKRGIYQLSPKGEAALETWADVVSGLELPD